MYSGCVKPREANQPWAQTQDQRSSLPVSPGPRDPHPIPHLSLPTMSSKPAPIHGQQPTQNPLPSTRPGVSGTSQLRAQQFPPQPCSSPATGVYFLKQPVPSPSPTRPISPLQPQCTPPPTTVAKQGVSAYSHASDSSSLSPPSVCQSVCGVCDSQHALGLGLAQSLRSLCSGSLILSQALAFRGSISLELAVHVLCTGVRDGQMSRTPPCRCLRSVLCAEQSSPGLRAVHPSPPFLLRPTLEPGQG